MTLPVYLHSGMAGAPSVHQLNGNANALLFACLVNGFNTVSATSASAASGVVTFTFAGSPGFSVADTVVVAGASNATANGKFRVQSISGNQVLIAVAGVPDGSLAGSITMKFSPLGWTRAFTGTNVAAYRQGGSSATKRFIRVYDGTTTADNSFYTRGYENMTAVSTGTGAFPTTAQVAGNGVGSNYAGVTSPAFASWFIIGTPRFFFLFTSWGLDNSANLTSFPANSMMCTWFGEISNVFKTTDVYAYVLASAASGLNNGFYMPRSYTGTGTAIASAYLYGAGGANTLCLGVTSPDPGSGDIIFTQAPIIYDYSAAGSVRGTLPGVICGLHAPVNYGTYPGGHQLTGVPNVTGRLLLVNPYASGAVGDIAFLMDEDWGDA